MTIEEVRKMLSEAGLEFFVSKTDGSVATIHVIIKENRYVA